MKCTLWKVGLVALFACSVASQGCLVPWSKYIKLKRQLEQLQKELAEKDSQLSDDQTRIQALNNDLATLRQLVKLYEDKSKDADKMRATAEQAVSTLQGRLDDFAKKYPGGVVANPDGSVTLKNTLLFETGKATLSDKGRQVLGDLAKEFQGTGEVFQIDGHTDDQRVAQPDTVRDHTDNWGLSAHRALAVLRVLGQSGIANNRLYIRAFSMYRPRASNDSPENRSQNRRVDVMFLPGPAAAPAP